MGKLIENTVEQAAIQWLQDQGYRYLPGPDIERPVKQVVLPDILRNFLQKTYPDIPQTALEEALAQFTHPERHDLTHRNPNHHPQTPHATPRSAAPVPVCSGSSPFRTASAASPASVGPPGRHQDLACPMRCSNTGPPVSATAAVG